MSKENGVTMPKGKGVAARIWQLANELSKQLKRPPELKEMLEHVKDANGPGDSITTKHFSKWCKYYGLESEDPSFGTADEIIKDSIKKTVNQFERFETRVI